MSVRTWDICAYRPAEYVSVQPCSGQSPSQASIPHSAGSGVAKVGFVGVVAAYYYYAENPENSTKKVETVENCTPLRSFYNQTCLEIRTYCLPKVFCISLCSRKANFRVAAACKFQLRNPLVPLHIHSSGEQVCATKH